MQKIGTNGDGKSTVVTLDGRSLQKKKKKLSLTKRIIDLSLPDKATRRMQRIVHDQYMKIRVSNILGRISIVDIFPSICF